MIQFNPLAWSRIDDISRSKARPFVRRRTYYGITSTRVICSLYVQSADEPGNYALMIIISQFKFVENS